MSNISANIVVETNPINVQVEQSEVGITVEPINLNVYTGGFSTPGGNVGELQYNGGILQGIPNVTYSGGNLSLGNVANVKILGGTNAYYLQTDGIGNLSWVPGSANVSGNGTAAGSNNSIQLSDGSGNFKVGAGFSFDPSSNVLSVPGNVNTTTVNTANIEITGTTTLQQAKEKVTTTVAPAIGTLNYDLLNQAIFYFTANATGNFTINFRGNSTTTLDTVMSSNQSMTCTLLNKNGVLPYYATTIQIDGNTVTPMYSTIPTGTSSATDMYTFNIIKTASNTFSVFGSIIGYV